MKTIPIKNGIVLLEALPSITMSADIILVPIISKLCRSFALPHRMVTFQKGKPGGRYVRKIRRIQTA